MQQLFQSAFLQSLGFAIANSLWQTALLWLVYIAISHLLPLSSAAKYRFAVGVQLLSFAWFVVTIQFYYNQYNTSFNANALANARSIQAVVAGNEGTTSQLLRYMIRIEQVLPYVSMAYLLLMLFLCLRWFGGYRQTQLVRKHGLQKIPVDWKLFVQRVSAQLGIKKNVRLFLSENITTPLTIGFLKPIILVPLASINHLTTQQLEAVLLHELAHIKRHDYLVNIVLSAVEIGLFFNPFTQILSKQIHKERENSCDDWVLQFQYQASDYAEALLRIAYMQGTPALAMAATGKKNDLLARVKRMIGQKENRFNYRKQLLALALVTTILSSIAWLSPTHAAHKGSSLTAKGKQINAAPKRSVAVEPMAAKVDNPLFNPVFFLSEPLKAEMEKGLAAAQKEIAGLNIPAVPGVLETVSPIVADALEIAASQMANKQPELDRQLSSLTNARKAIEGLLSDSVFVNGRIQSAEWDNAFKTALREVPANIEKAKKEIENSRQLKQQMNWDASSFKWDDEKVKKDIGKAMEEFKRISFDKFDFEKALTDQQKAAAQKEDQESKPRMRTKRSLPAPPPPDGPDHTPVFERKQLVDMPVININNKSFTLNLSPALLNELLSLAALAMRTDLDKASPEFQKLIQLKGAMIEKALSGKNRMINAVNREVAKESPDSAMIRWQ